MFRPHLIAQATLCILFAVLVAPYSAVGQGNVVVRLDAEPETDLSKASYWETVDGQPAELNWEFADDEVRLVNPRGYRGSLLSGPLPESFDLRWQWKLAERCNSGLKYRVRQFGSRWLGLEYQMIDEPPKSADKGSTASIYDLQAPVEDKSLRPAGQWNDSRVVAKGNRIAHYLNGQLVAESETWGPAWEAAIAKSKFWDADSFGKPLSGDRLMLTDHGGKAVFKNFQLTALTTPSQKEPQAQGPFLGNAIRNGWADQTSIVLWTRTTQLPEMNLDGPKFLEVSKSDQQVISQTRDSENLLSKQLPPGATLESMFGACPGAPGEVRLTYYPELIRKEVKTTGWTSTTAEDDFTAQWHLKDLRPGRKYAAVVEARAIGSDQVSAVIRGQFRTAPKIGSRDPLRFCITTCHDFLRRDDGLNGHKIYPSMTKLDPDFVIHAGDIEYYDKPDPWAWTIELMRFKWARIFSLPSNRRFYSQNTSYFVKDDHDTLKNDCWVGERYGSVTFAEGVRLFNDEQFPSHVPRYKTIQWGKDFQIWLLEGRDFRSPNNLPDGPEKTILGIEQRDWLLETLDQSDARFKLIISPTPIVGPDRQNKKDNHANPTFAHEGRFLRTELSKRPGVIVFCGDRHWQYASVDPQTGLWEFGCGPGSEKHQLGWKKGDERPAHRFLRVAGGFLTGDLSYQEKGSDAPTLTLRHRKVTGEVVSEFSFPQTDPINKPSSEGPVDDKSQQISAGDDAS